MFKSGIPKVLTHLALLLLPVVIHADQPLPASGQFTGQWNVTGEQQTMEFMDEREIAITRYRGQVNIKKGDGLPRSFFTECLSFGDTGGSGEARCEWVDSADEQIFIELTSRVVGSKGIVKGEIVGGSGKYHGIRGVFELEAWVYSTSNEEEREVTAYTDSLRGSWTFE